MMVVGFVARIGSRGPHFGCRATNSKTPIAEPIMDHISGITQSHDKTNLKWVTNTENGKLGCIFGLNELSFSLIDQLQRQRVQDIVSLSIDRLMLFHL
jgi:hypothetical protein